MRRILTSHDSAVEFPGQSRLHVALNVSNLDASKQFYELLLGTAPTKERPRYARFELQDPSVNLTLNETDGGVRREGGVAHFGVQVKSIAAVHAAIERFNAAGIETLTEEATTCCYAVHDKVWARDPDGHNWEVIVVLQADVIDEQYVQSGCLARMRGRWVNAVPLLPQMVVRSRCGSRPSAGCGRGSIKGIECICTSCRVP